MDSSDYWAWSLQALVQARVSLMPQSQEHKWNLTRVRFFLMTLSKNKQFLLFQVRALKGLPKSSVAAGNPTIGHRCTETGLAPMACCLSNRSRWGSEQNNNSNNAFTGSLPCVLGWLVGRWTLLDGEPLSHSSSPTTDVF